MNSFKWTSDLSVGVEEIDGQHKELFRRVNSLLEAMKQGRGPDPIGQVLLFLQDYVVIHFGIEELHMRESGYAGYAAHKGEHERFIEDLLAIKAQYEQGGVSAQLMAEVASRVCDWLKKHVMGTDKAFGKFLNRVGQDEHKAASLTRGARPSRRPGRKKARR